MLVVDVVRLAGDVVHGDNHPFILVRRRTSGTDRLGLGCPFYR